MYKIIFASFGSSIYYVIYIYIYKNNEYKKEKSTKTAHYMDGKKKKKGNHFRPLALVSWSGLGFRNEENSPPPTCLHHYIRSLASSPSPGRHMSPAHWSRSPPLTCRETTRLRIVAIDTTNWYLVTSLQLHRHFKSALGKAFMLHAQT